MAQIFKTLTLVNVLFVGYEVIATTAEEAKNPGRNIPIATVGTIFVCAVVYCSITFTALGIVSAKKLGWRGQLSTGRVSGSVVKDVVYGAPCDVAVLRDRDVMEEDISRILVPVGGGPHARLALRLAWDIIKASGGTLTLTRIFPEPEDVCEVELDVLRQMVEDELGEVPEEIIFRLKCRESVAEGILEEATEADEDYDLIVIGASEEWFLRDLLFGSIPDRVADSVRSSVLMVRKYEPAPVSWFRRMVEQIDAAR